MAKTQAEKKTLGHQIYDKFISPKAAIQLNLTPEWEQKIVRWLSFLAANSWFRDKNGIRAILNPCNKKLPSCWRILSGPLISKNMKTKPYISLPRVCIKPQYLVNVTRLRVGRSYSSGEALFRILPNWGWIWEAYVAQLQNRHRCILTSSRPNSPQ